MSMLLLGVGVGGSAPFDPSTVAGLKVWFKADSESYSNNDPVTTATDRSGNGNNFTEATNPPTFKTNILNGKPAYYFDGTEQLVGTFALDDTKKTNVFFVIKCDANSGINTVLCSEGDDVFFMALQGGSNIRTWSNTSGNFDDQASANYTTFHYYTFTFNETTSANGVTNYRENGSSLGDSASRDRGNSGALTLGDRGGQALVGHICEILIYETAGGVSGADITSIEGYLASKYGL